MNTLCVSDVTLVQVFSVPLSTFTALQGALMCILGTVIAAVLPVLAYIFVSPRHGALHDTAFSHVESLEPPCKHTN